MSASQNSCSTSRSPTRTIDHFPPPHPGLLARLHRQPDVGWACMPPRCLPAHGRVNHRECSQHTGPRCGPADQPGRPYHGEAGARAPSPDHSADGLWCGVPARGGCGPSGQAHHIDSISGRSVLPRGLIYKGLSARKCCGYREEMCVRIFHLQIIHAEKIAQFNGSFHPGVKVPLSFTNGNLWR